MAEVEEKEMGPFSRTQLVDGYTTPLMLDLPNHADEGGKHFEEDLRIFNRVVDLALANHGKVFFALTAMKNGKRHTLSSKEDVIMRVRSALTSMVRDCQGLEDEICDEMGATDPKSEKFDALIEELQEVGETKVAVRAMFKHVNHHMPSTPVPPKTESIRTTEGEPSSKRQAVSVAPESLHCNESLYDSEGEEIDDA
jgi:hypothetical protein